MFLGYVGRYFHPDDPGGTSPAPASEAAAAEPAPAAEPTPEPEAAAESDDDDPPDDDTPDPAETLTPAELRAAAERARRQAARYRTQLRSTEEALAAAQTRARELEQQLATPPAPDPAQAAEARAQAAERRALIAEVAAATGVPAPLLAAFRELQGASDEAAVAAALSSIREHLAPASAGGHRPPGEPSQPLTLDQQIADAERAGNTTLSLRLKAQKLAGA